MILAPANVVEVYLAGAPMWESWDWAATQAVNAQMLPFVQQLDPNDPLPADPRLVLPLTVAGFMLYRALHVDTGGAPRNSVAVVMAVYEEIARGIVILDRCFSDAATRKIRGEVSEDFLTDFAETVDAAQTLLLHAIRLGPETWDLILRCGLGTGCRLRKPYYVSRPGERSPHARCRTALSRTKAPSVTSKHRTRKT